MLDRLANNRKSGTLVNTLRRRRFDHFVDFIAKLGRPMSIIDVGGTESFWTQMNFSPTSDVRIVLLNTETVSGINPMFEYVLGDARKMCQFKDREFDLAFSNSVIEHVGGMEDQRRMATEMQRIASHFFLQTPNRHFPIEPHFLFPFFQFLPVEVRVWLVSHLSLGWDRPHRITQRHLALEAVSSIRLLSRSELKRLFPTGRVVVERFVGLPKSFQIFGESPPIE